MRAESSAFLVPPAGARRVKQQRALFIEPPFRRAHRGDAQRSIVNGADERREKKKTGRAEGRRAAFTQAARAVMAGFPFVLRWGAVCGALPALARSTLPHKAQPRKRKIFVVLTKLFM